MAGPFESVGPLGSLGRTNETENRDVQPADHNDFAETLDALRAAGITLEDALAAYESTTNDALDALTTTVDSKLTNASAFDVLGEAYAGMRLPARAMRRVTNSHRVRRIVAAGSSTTHGNTGAAWTQGGRGCWVDLLSIGLQGLFGPCLSRGFRGMWSGEWSLTGSWTQSTIGDAWDRAPWSQAFKHGPGGPATDYATWTKPTIAGPLNVVAGAEIFWLDAAGAAAPSYSIDGAAFVAFPQPRVLDNGLKSFYVTNTIESITSNIRIRPVTAAGVNAPVIIAGIRPWVVDPRKAMWGHFIDNLGNSGKTLYEFTRAASAGDPFAILDSVVNYEASQPGAADLLITGWSNDVVTGGGAGDAILYASELTTLVNRVRAAGGDALLWAPFEQAFRDTSLQQTFRNVIHTLSATLGVSSIDFEEAWSHALGHGWTAANAAGLMESGSSGFVHANEVGHADQAARFRRLISLAA